LDSEVRFESAATNPSPSWTTSAENLNLTDAEKELLRWYYDIRHLSFRCIQFLMRSRALGASETARRLHTACALLINPSMCAACQYAKQKTETCLRNQAKHHTRPLWMSFDRIKSFQARASRWITSSVRQRDASSVAVARLSQKNIYSGGCIFINSASSYIHVEFQAHLNTHEAL
jgi:hypothetical protein